MFGVTLCQVRITKIILHTNSQALQKFLTVGNATQSVRLRSVRLPRRGDLSIELLSCHVTRPKRVKTRARYNNTSCAFPTLKLNTHQSLYVTGSSYCVKTFRAFRREFASLYNSQRSNALHRFVIILPARWSHDIRWVVLFCAWYWRVDPR